MREDLILGIVFVFLNFCLTLMLKKFSVDIFNVYFKCALVLTRNIGFVINRVETLAVIDEPDMLNSQNLSKSSSQWPACKNNMPRCHYARILVFYSLFKEFSTNIIAFWVKFPSFWLHGHVQHRVIRIFEEILFIRRSKYEIGMGLLELFKKQHVSVPTYYCNAF